MDDEYSVSFSDPDLFARMPGAANGLDINHIYSQDDEDGVMLGMYSAYALYNRDCVIITNGIAAREYVDPEPYIEQDTDDSMSDEEKQEVREFWENAINVSPL